MSPFELDQRLEAQFLDRRILQISGELSAEAVARWSAALMMFDAEGDEPVELRISGGGGTAPALLTLLDTIDLVGVPVRATAVGGVSGAGALLVALCPWRRAAPSAQLRLEMPSVQSVASSTDVVLLAEEARATELDLIARLEARTRLSNADLEQALRRGRTFGANEAVEAGLVDEVGIGTPLRASGPRPLPS